MQQSFPLSSPSPSSNPPSKEAKSLYCLLATTTVSLLLLLSFSSFPLSRSPSLRPSAKPFLLPPDSPPPSPSLAYFLSASSSDCDRLLRLLFSVYHPSNHYLLHLDLTASHDQRHRLALAVQSVPVFRAARNVHVLGKADFANPSGPSALASTLHGAAVLLRVVPNWDWFINLSVDDYPLVTQDDLLHVLSFLPRDLNFVQHSSYIGWRESHRIKPIIVDPGLYLSTKSDIFYATQQREYPNAYRLFTVSRRSTNLIHNTHRDGPTIKAMVPTLLCSPSVILSRKFVEFCILGTDNLPRTLLMYYSNTRSSQSNYFQTVACNSQEFNKTTVNYNMHYELWDNPPKQEPHKLGMNDFEKMIQSGAAFGSHFLKDDRILERIDHEVLKRGPGMIVPGGWCLGGDDSDDPCTVWGDADILRPGLGAQRFSKNLVQLSNNSFSSNQCVSE